MEPGRSFGRYKLISRLGAGGMGEVYLATATGLDGVERQVALKIVRQLHQRRQKLMSLFLDEAKVSFLLNHPNIVQTYDVGQIDGHTFLVLEHVDGASLELLLERLAERAEALPPGIALYIASQIARGLDYAHTFTDVDRRPFPIVHRDISPGNVLLARGGQVKIADFGLAKSALRSVESDAGSVKGKLAYMPLEQLRGEPVDARADIYALGVMLYEMLAGAHPFGAVEQINYLDRLANKEPPRPLHQRAAVSSHVSELVATCMASAVEDRFGSAREVARLLDQNLRDLGSDVSEFELAELLGRVLAERPLSLPPSDDHPFDRVLGRELALAAQDGGVSTFYVREGAQRNREAGLAATVDDAAAPSWMSPTAVRTATEATTTGTTPLKTRPPWLLPLILILPLLLGGLLLARSWTSRSGQSGASDSSTAAKTAAKASPIDAARAVDLRKVAQAAVDAATAPTSAPASAGVTKATAALVLRPRPSGGRVTLDGQQMGVTPLSLSGLKPHKVLLVIETVGYRRFAQTVTLRPGATLTLEPTLQRRRRRITKTGWLSVNSDPWANVVIDGKALGNTPLLRQRLPVGRHRVTLINPGRKLRAVRTVTIRAGVVTKLSVLLK